MIVFFSPLAEYLPTIVPRGIWWSNAGDRSSSPLKSADRISSSGASAAFRNSAITNIVPRIGPTPEVSSAPPVACTMIQQESVPSAVAANDGHSGVPALILPLSVASEDLNALPFDFRVIASDTS